MSKNLSGQSSSFLGFISLIFSSCIFLSTIALADSDLLMYTGQSFSTKVTQNKVGKDESIKLRIFNSTHSKSSVFSVPNPDRIVIDLIGVKLKKNKDFTVNSSNLIKAVRLGAHSDKTRIVVDLSVSNPSSYRTTESEGELTLIINNAAPNEKVRKEKETGEKSSNEEGLEVKPLPTSRPAPTILKKTPTAIPTVELPAAVKSVTAIPVVKTPAKTKNIIPAEELIGEEIIIDNNNSDVMIEELIEKKPPVTPTKISIKTPLIVRTPTPLPTEMPEQVPATETIAAESTEVITPLPQTQELRGIKFGYSQGMKSNPLIKLDLVNKAQFELQKSDDKTYTLTIKDCREFKPELKLVNFPPHDFVGFTYVQAEADQYDIKIKIGVERNKRITATPNENEIWVSMLDESKTESRPVSVKKQSAVEKSMSKPTR